MGGGKKGLNNMVSNNYRVISWLFYKCAHIQDVLYEVEREAKYLEQFNCTVYSIETLLYKNPSEFDLATFY